MSIAKYGTNPAAVGLRIRDARTAASHLPTKVASELEISVFQLGKIERGEFKRPSRQIADAIERLMAQYGIETVAPIARTPSPPPQPAHSLESAIAALNKHQTEYVSMIAARLDELTRAMANLETRLSDRPRDGTARLPQESGRARKRPIKDARRAG